MAPEIFETTNEGDSSCSDKGITNLSNELRGDVIGQRRIENEEEENLSLAKESDMLIKSSVSLNCTDGRCEVPQMIDDLEENHYTKLAKRERAATLSGKLEDLYIEHISNWSSDPSFSPGDSGSSRRESRLVLGTEATE